MKKIVAVFFTIVCFTILSAYDGSAGASLNRSTTIEEYNRLITVADMAMEKDDPKLKKEAVSGIEDFLNVVEEYRGVSSKGATKYLEGFEKDLEEKLGELNKIK